jgi:hypothetical protein
MWPSSLGRPHRLTVDDPRRRSRLASSLHSIAFAQGGHDLLPGAIIPLYRLGKLAVQAGGLSAAYTFYQQSLALFWELDDQQSSAQ